MKKFAATILLCTLSGSVFAGITHRADDRQEDRNDRQDTRVECRVDEGAGKDKRDCKQEGRSLRN
ncbi:hypothetical protein GT360_15480 [Vibrio astriarenae]|uniref:Uncharacterized protein n=1 Tax=Vibrio astriarenae TaxID=1481923 RepID=A0A7Z2T640_9VIBR|nr:hypothetical protein [Vibrio astriarenae]QIA64965.1 hypothetical protein GT360_15480 [Vibrio astriarenae]